MSTINGNVVCMYGVVPMKISQHKHENFQIYDILDHNWVCAELEITVGHRTFSVHIV